MLRAQEMDLAHTTVPADCMYWKCKSGKDSKCPQSSKGPDSICDQQHH